ncbi:MAG: hypothetical protein NC931_05410 [Candidatus Omnitrophica bacterium]|nr:hypothetical protein [Candidatus Omnitrophota bacterium]
MKFTRPQDEGMKLSDLIKRFLFIFFSVLIILAGLTTLLFISSARNELTIIENQELKNISTISRLVIKNFDTAVSEVIFLAELSTDFISGKESKTKLLEAIFSFLKSKDYYQKIVLVDATCKILIEIKSENRELTLTHSAGQNIKNDLNFKKNYGNWTRACICI